MRRVAAALLAVLLVAAAVVGGRAIAGGGVTSTGVTTVDTAPGGIARRSGRDVYLVRGGRLALVVRPGRRGEAVRAVRALLAGPTAAERAHRLTTRLPETRDGPPGLRWNRVGEIRVRLPARTGRLSSLAVRQLACTVVRAILAGDTSIAGTRLVAGVPTTTPRPGGGSRPRPTAVAPAVAVTAPTGLPRGIVVVDEAGRERGAGTCPELLPETATPTRLPAAVAERPGVRVAGAAGARPAPATATPAGPARPAG